MGLSGGLGRTVSAGAGSGKPHGTRRDTQCGARRVGHSCQDRRDRLRYYRHNNDHLSRGISSHTIRAPVTIATRSRGHRRGKRRSKRRSKRRCGSRIGSERGAGGGPRNRGALNQSRVAATLVFAAQRRRRFAVGASPRNRVALYQSRVAATANGDCADSRPHRETYVAAARLGRCWIFRGFHPRLSAAAAARPRTPEDSRRLRFLWRGGDFFVFGRRGTNSRSDPAARCSDHCVGRAAEADSVS